MAGGAGLSPQCWSDLATRGVRADRVGAKLRHPLPSGWREAPGGESRPASGPKNLGWHRAEASRSSRKVRHGEDVTVSPGVGGRCGGRGPNPFRRFPPSPAQAGRAASDVALGIGWSYGCACGLFWLQSRRAALGLGVPSQRAASSLRIRLGLAILPRARVVKGRRKPVPRWKHRGPGDRLLKSRVLPPGEAQAELGGGVRSESFGRRKLERDKAALVEGRRPGSNEVIAFDEAAAEVGSGGVSWARPKVRTRCDGCDRGRQRLCTRARCAEDNAATGRLSAEELRPMLHQDRAGSSLGSASGLRSCMPAPGSRCYAEAGASSSSEAPSEDLPEAIGTATVRER